MATKRHKALKSPILCALLCLFVANSIGLNCRLSCALLSNSSFRFKGKDNLQNLDVNRCHEPGTFVTPVFQPSRRADWKVGVTATRFMGSFTFNRLMRVGTMNGAGQAHPRLGVRREAKRHAALDVPGGLPMGLPPESGVALRLPPHSKTGPDWRTVRIAETPAD